MPSLRTWNVLLQMPDAAWCFFYSLNGLDWKLAKHPLVSDLNIKWENGDIQKLYALERPQLFLENGKLVVLLCAVNSVNCYVLLLAYQLFSCYLRHLQEEQAPAYYP